MTSVSQPAKVLAVDDREVNLLVLARILDELEVDVVQATSGDQALSLMLEHDFAVVLMDVQMPDMDGFETVELMRRNRRTRHIPVVFVSAGDRDEAFLPTTFDVGIVDCVFKPVDPTILRSKVQVFAELHHLRRELEERTRELAELSARLHPDASTDLSSAT